MKLVCIDMAAHHALATLVKDAVRAGKTPSYVELTRAEYDAGNFRGRFFEVFVDDHTGGHKVTVEFRLVPA